MRTLELAQVGLLMCLVGACAETPYPFFVEEGSGGGSACVGTTCSTGGGAGADGDFPGEGVEPPGPACESASDPALVVEKLELLTGMCLAAGAPTLIAGSPGYELALVSCADAVEQGWTVRSQEMGLEIRSESVGYNLDVRFAASSDGTPIVLYSPHRLYNQLFMIQAAFSGVFRLAPLHAPTQCLSQRGDRLELWPCATTETGIDQLFRRTSCR